MRCATRYDRPLPRRPAAPLRRAVATVELAICLPVLALLIFGSIQCCDVIYLQHALNQAAYEGSVELGKSGATSTTVLSRVGQVLNTRGVETTSIRITPGGADVSDAPAGTVFTIEASAAPRANLMLSGFFASPNELTGRVVSTR